MSCEHHHCKVCDRIIPEEEQNWFYVDLDRNWYCGMHIELGIAAEKKIKARNMARNTSSSTLRWEIGHHFKR